MFLSDDDERESFDIGIIIGVFVAGVGVGWRGTRSMIAAYTELVDHYHNQLGLTTATD